MGLDSILTEVGGFRQRERGPKIVFRTRINKGMGSINGHIGGESYTDVPLGEKNWSKCFKTPQTPCNPEVICR